MHTWFDAQLDQKIVDFNSEIVKQPDRKVGNPTSV